MRLRAMLTAVVLTVVACGGGADPVTGADGPVVMSLALHQLVAEDNSFGSGHRFTELLVQDRIDPSAGSAMGSDLPGRLLTTEEREAIEAALADLGPVRWIEDPDEHRTDDLQPLTPGSAIIGVGEAVFDDDGALVPVSLWCGGLCGIWITYRLVQTDAGWSVVGPEGPVVIS